jgi:hypothetical protein
MVFLREGAAIRRELLVAAGERGLAARGEASQGHCHAAGFVRHRTIGGGGRIALNFNGSGPFGRPGAPAGGALVKAFEVWYRTCVLPGRQKGPESVTLGSARDPGDPTPDTSQAHNQDGSGALTDRANQEDTRFER